MWLIGLFGLVTGCPTQGLDAVDGAGRNAALGGTEGVGSGHAGGVGGGGAAAPAGSVGGGTTAPSGGSATGGALNAASSPRDGGSVHSGTGSAGGGGRANDLAGAGNSSRGGSAEATDGGAEPARGGAFGSARGGNLGAARGGNLGAARGGATGSGGAAPSAQGGTSGGAGTTGGSTTPTDGGSGGASGGGRDLLVPEDGILLGLYYGDASISATQQKLGRMPPLHLTYYAWSDDFTQGVTAEDLRSGRIPLINWELYDITLDAILSGSQDALIQRRARAMKQLAKPVFLDFGAEMNGDWSPWGGAQNGRSAEMYLGVYRKVHDVFVAEGADNVVWAWCPNVTDVPRESWNEALDYYPGDSYVDWVCVDGYNWGNTNEGAWQSFADVFKDIYPKLASKNKPILIGEMASAEAGGDKGAWIDAMLPTLKQKYPSIRGLVWFDVNKETDWRISSSSGALAAFKRLASDPYTNP